MYVSLHSGQFIAYEPDRASFLTLCWIISPLQELEEWLKSDESESAGWPKEGADGETIGHESGKKIVEILRENPSKVRSHGRSARSVKANWRVVL